MRPNDKLQDGTPSKVDEPIIILTQIKVSTPPAGFDGVIQVAARVLDPEDWKALKLRMEANKG